MKNNKHKLLQSDFPFPWLKYFIQYWVVHHGHLETQTQGSSVLHFNTNTTIFQQHFNEDKTKQTAFKSELFAKRVGWATQILGQVTPNEKQVWRAALQPMLIQSKREREKGGWYGVKYSNWSGMDVNQFNAAQSSQLLSILCTPPPQIFISGLLEVVLLLVNT